MSANCPHCNETIDRLSGFITQEDHEKRIKAKSELIDTLTSDLKTARKASESVADLQRERDDALGQVKRLTRSTALAKRQITDEKTARTLELVYENEMADRPEDERVDFADFDKWATDHPLFGHLFKAEGGGQQVAGQQAAGQQGNQGAGGERKLPLDQGGGHSPGHAKPRTADQIASIVRSPDFQKLTLPEQRAKLDAMREEDAALRAS